MVWSYAGNERGRSPLNENRNNTMCFMAVFGEGVVSREQ